MKADFTGPVWLVTGASWGIGREIACRAARCGARVLAAAVKAASLVETLQSDGPFTVFAPTDGAFAQLPAGTLDDLLANPEQLKKVLFYR